MQVERKPTYLSHFWLNGKWFCVNLHSSKKTLAITIGYLDIRRVIETICINRSFSLQYNII